MYRRRMRSENVRKAKGEETGQLGYGPWCWELQQSSRRMKTEDVWTNVVFSSEEIIGHLGEFQQSDGNGNLMARVGGEEPGMLYRCHFLEV